LQNLSNGELRIAPPLPEIDNLFVDQLLTSDLFGLNSTLSPALDGKFVRYYDLLAKPPESLQQGERKELDELDHDLSESGLMGDSKRQRILYRVIDREIAKARKSADFNEWSEDSLRLVEEVLSNNVDYRDMAND
jgi:hypothetical protein